MPTNTVSRSATASPTSSVVTPPAAPFSPTADQRLVSRSGPLTHLWRAKGLAWTTVLGVAVISGLLVAWLMPRGPITTAQALTVLVGSLLVGVAGGLVTRSRWSMLAVPVLHVMALETGRLGGPGATLGMPHLDTTYGVVAFVLSRGFYMIVALLPQAWGASVGAALARRVAGGESLTREIGQRVWLRTRQAATGLVALALLSLTVGLVLPASTPPVLDASGQPIPGSIASLEPVRLGGQEQWILVRAADTSKPVLLYLSGGPGQSDLPFIRAIWTDIARDFVLVDWDQRGTGKSYPALDPTASLTLDQMVSDTIELTDYLRARFGAQKIYLTGESWGSTLGVLAAQRAPELYYAFIGSGQMVSQLETDRRLYRDMLDLAARSGDTALAAKMRAYGEPPYGDVYAQALVMEQYEKLYRPYEPPAAYMERGSAANLGPWGILGSEYTLIEKVNLLRAALDMNAVLYPQLERGEGLDFRRDVPRLEVPLYVLDGQAELTARRDLALEWFAMVQAPRKRLFSFENAAHSVSMEQFEAFHRILLDTVVPETYPGAGAEPQADRK